MKTRTPVLCLFPSLLIALAGAVFVPSQAARGQSIDPSVTVVAGDTAWVTISGLNTDTNLPRQNFTLVSANPMVATVPASVDQPVGHPATLQFKVSGVIPGETAIIVTMQSDPSFEDYCQVTVDDPDLTFSPSPITVDYADTIPITITRPFSESDATLNVTVRAYSRCVFGLGTDSSATYNYGREISFTFYRLETSRTIYLTGLSYYTDSEPIRASVGTYTSADLVTCNGYTNWMPVALPLFSDLVAGDARSIAVIGLPPTTNLPPATVHLVCEDDTRVHITNSFNQQLNGEDRYFSNYDIAIAGIRRLDNLFEPVRINLTATYELNEAMGGCISWSGAWWTNSIYVYPRDPTFEFRTPADVRVGDTYPLVIRRIGLQSGANLYFDLYTDDETVLGLGPTNIVLQTNKSLRVMFNQFEWSKTVYVSGLALTENYSTNIRVTAQVGSYRTNTLVLVSPNDGLVLSPLAPQVAAGDVISMTVSRPSATNVSDLTVYITAESPQYISAPESVVIPAGEQSASFPVTALLPGASVIRVTAIGTSNTVDSSRTVTVVNPTISFIPTIVSNAVGDVVVVTIHRPSQQAGSELRVDLQVENPSIFMVYSNSVTIPAGHISANVTLECLAQGSGALAARVGTYYTSLQVNVGEPRDADDPDGDGLNGYWENYLGGDPNNAHTWDPILDDGEYDSDGDGLSNLDEILTYRTDPLLFDSDGDGVGDGEEISQDLTWPLHPMSCRLYHERSLNIAQIPAGGMILPDSSRFAVRTNGWTVELWSRPQTDGNGEYFSFGRDGTNTGFWVGLENFRPKVEIYNGGNLLVSAGGTNVLPVGDIQQLTAGEWSHVAFVWAPERNSLEVYVDGILLIARETLAAPDFAQGAAYLCRGLTDGYIDELRVWDFDRTWEEVEYWHNRLYPAPSGYVQAPSYGGAMNLYYRFDEVSGKIVDYAFLNNTNYFLEGPSVMVTNQPAVSLLGSDDEDGDGLPEWWTKMHGLDEYPIVTIGPTLMYYDDVIRFLARIKWFKSFRAYASIGTALSAQNLGPDQVDNRYYTPVDTSLGFDAHYSTFLKYVYIDRVPQKALLYLYANGMTQTVAYVNGERLTALGNETNSYQVLDISSKVKLGRNMVFVRCESGIMYYLDEGRNSKVVNPDRIEFYEGAHGKFDAQLVCDNIPYIRRGDHGRNDPRSVWFVQTWSTHEQLGRDEANLGDPTLPDNEGRAAPGNQDYGLPFDADLDNFNAYNEYSCGTNPRDHDSNNNGVPDGLEDNDDDGLVNADEQTRGSHPLLRDTDDDGLVDGLDAIGENDPASAFSPLMTRALALSGNPGDFAGFPKQKRFALENWTVEAWVQRDPADVDGGVVVKREVGPKGINFELGLGDGSPNTAGLNIPYIRYVSVEGTNVIAADSVAIGTDWTHLAGTYDNLRRELILYVDGTAVATESDLKSPTIYAGGPVIQRIGEGIRGHVDEVRFWKYARTDLEILDHFDRTVPISGSNLVAYYRFDDGTSYTTNPALIGTSYNNWTNVMPWTWGQAQDYLKTYDADWREKWSHAVTLAGETFMTTNGGGALDNPPSLQVNILPSAAVADGAQWRIAGFGDWNNSGATVVDGLEEGDYLISFRTITGWTTPDDITVSVSNNTKTTLTATYIQNGALRVELTPPDAISQGALWRVDGGEWRDSGVTVQNLIAAGHYVEFMDVAGWTTPQAVNLVVQPGLLTTYIASYSNIAGSVTVYIEPEVARINGARWRVDGGVARESGTTASGLSFGSHTISFLNAIPWVAPSNIVITLANSETVELLATYELANGGQNDSDGDGLNDWDEVMVYKTDPLRADSDNDGALDGAEVVSITHPLHPMSSTNYFERSMDLSLVPSAGFVLPDTNRFLVATNGWTVETWIRPGADGNGCLFSLGMDGTNNGFWVGLENHRPKAIVVSGIQTQIVAGGVGLYGSIQELPRDQWTHLAFCWSPERNTLEVYIHGVLLIAQETLAAPTFIAGPAVLAQGFLDGYLDETRIWAYDRTWEEIEYWHNRHFPAPSGYIETPLYGRSLAAYFRFDDGGTQAVDFAYLNNADYLLPAPENALVTNIAVSLLGNDDEDGDGLPEWWVQIHNLDMYPDFNYGPVFLMGLIEDCHFSETKVLVYTNYFDKEDGYVARVDYYKSARVYTSVGHEYSWLDDVDNMWYSPKDVSLGYDGRYSAFLKYVYLKVLPKSATLNLFTPGMEAVKAYVNGVELIPDGSSSNAYQSLDITDKLKPGRNAIHVRCVSLYYKYLDANRDNLANPDYDCNHFEGSIGKFDANLICDGIEVIRRGDHTRNDPRSVWHLQTWSSSIEIGNDPPYWDKEHRALPGNLDYGLPLNADSDPLTAHYEYLVRTNPRDGDSNNNGIPDDLEDFDGDGLRNGEEQEVLSDPRLPDTDDDGIWDGMDMAGDNDPVSALSPVRSRALVLGGTTNDYAVFPIQSRFALQSWTVEAWIRPSGTELNGGIIVQRVVGPLGVNFELGLGDGSGIPVNYPYVKYASEDGATVVITNGFAVTNNSWIHLAGTYDSDRREMTLYANGEPVAVTPEVLKGPARYAGGPILQRIGPGFSGMIDEVRIWNTARPHESIQANFYRPVSVSEANLIAYYRFDDGTSYSNATPVIGTSANNLASNGVVSRPWTWGQIQDYVKAYDADWAEKWYNAASLVGNTVFSPNDGGALYTPPSLQVYILPGTVATNGAQWRIVGVGSWHDSGFTVSDNLNEGIYTVAFSTYSNWTAPANMQVTLSNDTKTIVVGVYQQNGSLRVNIEPGAVTNSARWRVDGGDWQQSGVTVIDLLPGSHTLEFNDVSGWDTPPSDVVTINSGELTTYYAEYTRRETSLRVMIQPPDVITEGAQWRFEDTPTWYDSGATLLVSNSSYRIEYRNVQGWLRPPTTIATVEEGTIGIVTGSYYRFRIWDSFVSNFVGNFNNPRGMAVDSQRRMYVADQLHHRVLRLTSISNDVWDAIGSYGTALGQFNQPVDVYVDVHDNLYVADAGNNRVQMRSAATLTWTNLGMASGLVSAPMSIAASDDGIVYVADTGNNRILKRAANGIWSEFLRADDGNNDCGVTAPQDIEIDDEGYLYIADYPNAAPRIRKVSSDAICFELIGSSDTNYGGLSGAPAISLDPDHGRLLVADRDNNRIMARTLSHNSWSRLVGNTNECVLNLPEGLTIDQVGNLYIADTWNDRVIRLELDWNYISTPSIASMQNAGGAGGSAGYMIQFEGQENVFYDIRWATNLLPFPIWYSLGRQMLGSNGNMICIDTNTRVPIKFYRIDAY